MSSKISPLIITIIFFSTLTLHSHSSPTNSPQPPNTNNDNILYDIYPFIRVYKNGTVQRFIGQDFSPPSPTDPTAPVHSKDVHFSQTPNLSARIYLPNKKYLNSKKLPLLIYFHGGGFFTESAFSSTYHNHLNSLVAKAEIVAVSVNYRLAPEHPLPVAYEDSWLALKWSFSHSSRNGVEPWLNKYADFNRVYLGGDSAGANIAHQMSIRVGSENPYPGVDLRGMFLNCPYFLGKRKIGNENETSFAYAEDQMEKLWVYAYPNSSAGLDDPFVNPGMDPGLKRVGCKRLLVYVAGNDVLRVRGLYYKRVLERSGWGGVVKVVVVEGENHVFNLVNPSSSKAVEMLRVVAYFINH